MFFNRWGLLHLAVSTAALFTATIILSAKEIQGDYGAAWFIVFSIVALGVGMYPSMAVKETKDNFLVFLPSWFFYFFAAVLPSFTYDAYSGALGSWWIFFIASTLQWFLGTVLINEDERSWGKPEV